MGRVAGAVDIVEAMTSAEVSRRLRDAGPVHLAALPNGLAVWMVVRHAEARAALEDPRLSVAGSAMVLDGGLLAPDTRAGMATSLMTADPPDHTRLRALVSSAFSGCRVEALRPRIEQLTEDLIDAFAGRETADLVAELAVPLPIQVICELLGIPSADRSRFRAWSAAFVAGVGTPRFPAAQVTEFIHYLRGLVAHRRREPDDSLLSALIQARNEDDALSEDELTSTVFLVITAGHDTTLSLVGNGLFLLLTHPEQAAPLAAEPQRLPAALEEFLRFESPVPMSTFRTATEPVDLGGTRIEAGDLVMICLQSANRDESVFPDSARLDLARADGRHLAFGHGIHHCLGAPLARLQGEVAIGAILRRFPDLRLAVPADDLVWRAGMFMHGLTELPVRLRRAGTATA